MEPHQLWVFVHIMLLVYWLGADLGVLILAQMTKNADQSPETRAALLKGALLIDIVPRLCFALMVPVGLTLARSLELLAAPDWVIPLAWAWATLWCALTLMSGRWEGTPAAGYWRIANLSVQGVIGALFLWAGVTSLGGSGPLQAEWLAWKAIWMGLCYPAAIMIDVAFGPAIAAFGAIATGQGGPDVEARYKAAVNHTCLWVGLVYLFVALAAFWGTVKPA
jgi:hypothetical protein